MPQRGAVARALRKVITRPEALRATADQLEAEAFALRCAADDFERDKARERARAQRWKDVQAAAMRVATGSDLDAEAARLAANYGHLFGSSSEGEFRRVLMDRQSHARAVITFRRNREVMMLARRGWTNEEIAAFLPRMGFAKVHPKHVSRVIQECLHGKLS